MISLHFDIYRLIIESLVRSAERRYTTKTLCSCLLVNHSFYTLAHPALYRVVRFETWPMPFFHNLQQFPERAKYIRSVS